MLWNEFSGFTFCEGTWLNTPWYLPAEVANCLSSLILVAVGVRGGAVEKEGTQRDMCRLLYAALTACGIGSALFHAKFIYAFRFLDEFSMIHLATLGCYAAVCKRYPRGKTSFVAAVALILSNVVLAEIDFFAPSPAVFRSLFCAPLLAVAALTVAERRIYDPLQKGLALRALAAAAAAGMSWAADLLLCDYALARFLFLHAWWHLFVAAAANHLIELNFSRGENGDKRRFRGGPRLDEVRAWRLFTFLSASPPHFV
uniref:Ceramidase n=1 Tax=Marseillevirus LCMAC103 TaxID=2506604 RepID=A0A481YW96_9VIRU|nr:MAG: ceramidase [Marseillevirus LCMAC103]